MAIEQVTMNLAPLVRNVEHNGRKYMAAPVAMLTEGVHKGSNGALYYPAKELKKTPVVWNMKPVVVYHPQINGQGVSACDPDILEKHQVGVVMNTRYDGKLRAEVWIERERAEAVDERVLNALDNSQMMEVSTGLFTDNVHDPGVWNGEEYDYIATNHRPDHLALLPDKKGACSIADGAGLFQLNELTEDIEEFDLQRLQDWGTADTVRMVQNVISHSHIYDLLHKALRDKVGRDTFVIDVYPKFFVYDFGNALYKLGYKVKSKTKVELDGTPEEVTRVTEYRKADGSLVSNAAAQRKGVTMTKEELVDNLVDNEGTNYEADDREWLMELNEEKLKKMQPTEEPEPTDNGKGKKKKPKAKAPNNNEQETEVEKAAQNGAAEIAPNNNGQSLDEYINNAPPEMRDVLRNGLATYNEKRDSLIEKITANDNCQFTAEQLEQKPIDELEAIHALAAPAGGDSPTDNQGQHQHPQPSYYGGQALPSPTSNKGAEEAGLAIPTMNFDDE